MKMKPSSSSGSPRGNGGGTAQARASEGGGAVDDAATQLIELKLQKARLEQENEHLRQATAALKDSRDLYLDLYEFAPVGYLTLTSDARIAAINLTGSSLLGMDRKTLLGLSFLQFVKREDRDTWRLSFQQALQHEGRHICEMNLQQSDGTPFAAGLGCLRIVVDGGDPMLRIVLGDISDQKRAEQARVEEALRLRDALTREVHHRIKNNLQVVVGLLSREAGKRPELGSAMQSAIAQVQSVAVVHGLYGSVLQHRVMLCELLPAVVQSVANLTGVEIVQNGVEESRCRLMIKESETVAVALILNELLTNAAKYSFAATGYEPPQVELSPGGATGCIRIVNRGCLPEGFDFDTGRGGGTGLGLVRALLPTPGMLVRFRQTGARVEVEVTVQHPILSAA
ncbi:MAG: histidine kinase dimerization/phosphoacceptor domain -containing protein [Azoarcus sp.]|nr:histidine kinase dimerization/phosphoacceptor domain -containing protein [Azoarcus sp.]